MTGLSLRNLAAPAAAVAFALALAGCAGSGPPPVLYVKASNCTVEPERSTAVPLVWNAEKPEPTKISIGTSSPCLDLGEAGKSLYGIAALPDQPAGYMLAVAAEPAGQGIFAPHLVLLDEEGGQLREISRDSFLFRGSNLSAQFRVHDDERYLVVASDPKTVGGSISRIDSRTQVSSAGGPVYFFNVYTGSESHRSMTYSHTGEVSVTAKPIPGLDD